MGVKLINIVETVVSKQDVYYRVFDDSYGIGQIVRQSRVNRDFSYNSTKQKIEKLIEKYKPKSYPSRYNCNFVFETLEEAKKFNELAHAGTRKIYKVKILPKGNIIKVDSARIGYIWEDFRKSKEKEVYWYDSAISQIKDYWTGKPNEIDPPLWEILFNGDIQIIERIENA